MSVVRSSLRGMTARPTREEAILAVLGLGWVAGWLWSQPQPAFTVALVCSLGLLVSRRQPQLAAAVVLAGCLLGTGLGVPADNPATLVPVAVVVYGLGRWAGRWAALLGLLCCLVDWGWADALEPATLLFGAVLYGCFWGFGRLVAVKNARASAAREQAARVGGQDPRMVADAVVAEERARLASDIARVVGVAVEAMVADVGPAERELDPVLIERIRVRGTSAVAELRRLLGLLRHPPDPADPPELDAPEPGRRRWVPYVVTGLVLALAVVDVLIAAPQTPSAVLVLLGLFPLVLLLRRKQLLLALLLSAGVMGMVALIHPTQPGLAAVAVIVLLSWSAGVDGRRAVWIGWILLTAISAILTLLASPDNVAMHLVVTLLAAWAGHAWSESDRVERSAQQETTQAQSALDEAVAEAVRQERLRVARDLHDVTSHALGVMVLQAGAANAQRVSDPARARASLAVVADAGSRALADLGRLTGLIDAGVLGVVADEEPTELAERLGALADRIRQTGARVSLRTSLAPTDPEVRQVCYRVVQEALTNAVRHAAGSAVAVVVESSDAGCRISVVDDGGRPSQPDGHDAGFGLVGAAERVRALGGDFAAGPESSGGWAVRASVPARAEIARSQVGAVP